MKKFLAISLCVATLFISGCSSSNKEDSSNSSNTSQTMHTTNVNNSTNFLSSYFSNETEDSALDKFKDSNDLDKYIEDNITHISIDGHEFIIKETKFYDVANIIKPYVLDEPSNGMSFIENIDNIPDREMFYVKAQLSNSTTVILRFKPTTENISAGDFVLSSFTVIHDVYAADPKDKLANNISCIVPLTVKEDTWKSKINDKVSCDSSGVNIYYLYHDTIGFTTTDDVKIGAYSIQTAFDREYGYLVYLSYEVNS